MLYFIVDDADNVYFVLVHDKPSNGLGGFVNMRIDSPDLGGKNVSVLLKDDPFNLVNSCENYPQNGTDCYAWNSTSAKGSFAWTWVRS